MKKQILKEITKEVITFIILMILSILFLITYNRLRIDEDKPIITEEKTNYEMDYDIPEF